MSTKITKIRQKRALKSGQKGSHLALVRRLEYALLLPPAASPPLVTRPHAPPGPRLSGMLAIDSRPLTYSGPGAAPLGSVGLLRVQTRTRRASHASHAAASIRGWTARGRSHNRNHAFHEPTPQECTPCAVRALGRPGNPTLQHAAGRRAAQGERRAFGRPANSALRLLCECRQTLRGGDGAAPTNQRHGHARATGGG